MGQSSSLFPGRAIVTSSAHLVSYLGKDRKAGRVISSECGDLGCCPGSAPFLKAVTLSKSLNLSEGSVCFDPKSLCRARSKWDA